MSKEQQIKELIDRLETIYTDRVLKLEQRIFQLEMDVLVLKNANTPLYTPPPFWPEPMYPGYPPNYDPRYPLTLGTLPANTYADDHTEANNDN